MNTMWPCLRSIIAGASSPASTMPDLRVPAIGLSADTASLRGSRAGVGCSGGRDRQSQEDKCADEVGGLLQSHLRDKPKRVAAFAQEIDRGADPPITMNLHNVFAETLNISGDERAARLRTAVLGMVPPPRPATWLDAAPKLLPAVRAASWVGAGGLEGLIRVPLAPFVSVLCAIDSEHAMTFATESDLHAWGVTAADAMQTASGNLARQQVQVGRAGQIAIIMGPDGYISSWLALPSVLGRIAKDVGDEVIALAPARDQLILFNTSDEAGTVRQLDETLTEYRSEEHTSELQSHLNLVCRLLLENKNLATNSDPTRR